MNLRLIIVVTAVIISFFLFQNCQNVSHENFSRDSLNKNNNNSGTASAESMLESSGNSSVTGTTSNGSSTSLKVNAVSSAGAQVDCSRGDATISQEITNAGADILVCLEFSLDLPSASRRYGEYYRCNSSTGFRVPDSSWSYNQAERKWTASQIHLQNNPYLVPGSYVLAVKDNTGTVHRSATMIVKKSGSENCSTTSTSTSTSTPTTGTSRVANGTIVISSQPLAGTYTSEQALINRANEIRFDSCINLDGRQIYLGFGPCLQVVSQGGTTTTTPPTASVPTSPVRTPAAPAQGTTSPSAPVAPSVTVPSDCPAVSSNVKIKDLIWTANTNNTFQERLSTNQIIAFRVTPSSIRAGGLSAAMTGGEKATKSLVVSRCPGDMAHPISPRCYAEGFEVANLSYTSRAPGGAASRYSCDLNLNETVYINIKNATLSNLSGNSCSASACPFYYTFR